MLQLIQSKDKAWWIWLVTALLLSAGFILDVIYFQYAIILTILQTLLFWYWNKSPVAFQVQVRLGYLVFLLIAQFEGLEFIFALQLVGTWVQILFNYCMMARITSLYPWNRSEPLSIQLIRSTFFSLPVQGSVQKN